MLALQKCYKDIQVIPNTTIAHTPMRLRGAQHRPSSGVPNRSGVAVFVLGRIENEAVRVRLEVVCKVSFCARFWSTHGR